MRKSSLLLSFLLFIISSIAQKSLTDTAKTSSKDSSKLEEISSRLDEVLKRMKGNEAEQKQYVGQICLKSNLKIPVYRWDNNQQESASQKEFTTIKRVTLLIKDGYILDINVYTEREQFTNTRAPINISTRRFSNADSLGCITTPKRAIVLRDFLMYMPFNTFSAEDGFIELNAKKSCDSLYRNVGLNTVVDLRFYSDALGLLAAVANGLTITDIRFKQILHRQNVSSKGGFFGHYIKFNLNATKFDSKINYIDSGKFSRTTSIQKSWINVEAAYNVLSSWIERKSLNTFYADLGIGLNVFQLAGLKDTSSVISQNVFTELGLNLKSSDNVGFEFLTRLWVNYSPQTRSTDENNAIWFWKIGSEIYWNPLNERAGRVFSRVNYVLPLISKEKADHFFQVQLGYSLVLTKALKGSK